MSADKFMDWSACELGVSGASGAGDLGRKITSIESLEFRVSAFLSVGAPEDQESQNTGD